MVFVFSLARWRAVGSLIGISSFFHFSLAIQRSCVFLRWNPGYAVWSWDIPVVLFYIGITTYLLTYFMEQSPSWEANRFAASQEIPRILWNPKVHYRFHNFPPPVPILSQLIPVHTPTSYFLKIHFNIILPSTPGTTQWSLSLRFPHQNPEHASPFPIRATCTPISFFSTLSPAQ
jgi:hypothetical protein